MNAAQKISVLVLASMWTLVGGFLVIAGGMHVAPFVAESGLVSVLMIGLALGIGFFKGKYALTKVANRSLAAMPSIRDELKYYLGGWLVMLGMRGVILIGIMIILGIALGSWLETISPALRGGLRIAIGTALLIGSWKYWTELRSSK